MASRWNWSRPRNLLITLYDHDDNPLDPDYLVSYDYTSVRLSNPDAASYTLNVQRNS